MPVSDFPTAHGFWGTVVIHHDGRTFVSKDFEARPFIDEIYDRSHDIDRVPFADGYVDVYHPLRPTNWSNGALCRVLEWLQPA